MRMILIAGCMLLFPTLASAQRVEIEAHAGVAIGSHSETLAELETIPRPAFSLLAKGRFWKDLSIFAGGSFVSFGCNDGWCRRFDIESIEAIAGVEGRYRFLWARAGGGYGTTTIQNDTRNGPVIYGALGARMTVKPISLLPSGSIRWNQLGDEHALSLNVGLGFAYELDLKFLR